MGRNKLCAYNNLSEHMFCLFNFLPICFKLLVIMFVKTALNLFC